MGKRLLIATGIFPPDIGGPATMLESLARSLSERGFEIKIITYSDKQQNNKTTLQLGGQAKQQKEYEIFRIKKNLPFGLSKIKYWKKIKQLSKWADVIYATDTYSVGFFSYLLKKKFNQSYILRFTGDSAWETSRSRGWTKDYIMDFNNGSHPERNKGSRRIQNKIKKLKRRRDKILFNANKIIVDSEFNKNLAQKIGVSSEKISVIYNAIDFKDIKINQKKVSQIKNKYKGKIILTACRLTPWKGVDKIIEILPELKEKVVLHSHVELDRNKKVLLSSRQEPGANTKINFLILGEGSELKKLKNIVRLNWVLKPSLTTENNVHFLGKISQNEIVNYFSAADVFVLNSDYEGLSHTLLEVMKIGTPIITTKSGGNPELIKDNLDGLLVNYGDQQGLQNALTKILNNSPEYSGLADKFSQNAKQKVKEFKWENVVEKTVEVIKSLGK